MEQLNCKKRVYPFFLSGCITTLISVFFAFALTASAEEAPLMRWTAADMLPVESGISNVRYGYFGLGAYPWKPSMPGQVVRVRVDGVPLYGLSPFGPDLDLVPAVFVDSVDCRHGLISIRTKTAEVEKPVTRVDFLLGERHRFRFRAAFQKKLSGHSSLFLGGASDGIHGSQNSEAASFRSYLSKYQRTIANGGKLFFTARALRDRDGLINLKNKSHMGDRETDILSLSLGVDGLQLTARTRLSPVVYYRSGISRFKRQNVRKSLDDDGFGLMVTSSTELEKSCLDVTFSSDVRSIDSRIHDKSWNRDETRLSVSWGKAGERIRYDVHGGVLGSSTYGTGLSGGGEFAFRAAQFVELSLRGAFYDEFPDAGMEFYPALEFSDTTIVSDLDMYRCNEFEAGFTVEHGMMSWGIFGFCSGSRHPLIEPETFLRIRGEKGTFPGVRFFLSADKNDRYHSDVQMHYTGSSGSGNLFPYPRFEFLSHSRLSRRFFSEKFDSCLFGTVRVSNWDDMPNIPDRTSVLLDCGISITVMNLSVFLKVETVAGKNLQWFDTLEHPGITSLWGVRWKLED